MIAILVAVALANGGSGGSTGAEISGSPEERFQLLARRLIGGQDGCPDAVPGPPPSPIVATIRPRVAPRSEPRLAAVDIRYTNTGRAPLRIERRYLEGKDRPDNVWIYDRAAKRWLDYVGPHGRIRRPRPEDYVVLRPGESRENTNVDLTRNFTFPTETTGLAAKVLFEPSWEPGPRIESRCVPLRAP
jgi:hypothetical protein